MIQKILIICSLILFLIISPRNVYANLPDIISDLNTTNIPSDSKEFFVYFGYGNPVGEREIINKSLSVEIVGQNLEIITNKVFDLYNDNGSLVACNNTYGGSENQVNASLITKKNILNYGPRTQNQPQSNLGKGYTGCLKVGIKILNSENITEIDKIIFNQDAQNSPSYGSKNQPGKQILQIDLRKSSGCEAGFDLVKGECLAVCKDNLPRDKNGDCLEYSGTCKIGEENVRGECLPVCSGERNKDGTCAYLKYSKSSLIINVIFNSVVLTILGYFGWILYKKYKSKVKI